MLNKKFEANPARNHDLIALLNEDLAREYRSVISSVFYSHVVRYAQYLHCATEFERHAALEIKHATIIAGQIAHLGGKPLKKAKQVRTSYRPEDMFEFDYVQTIETITHYQQRIRQCEGMGNYSTARDIRDILSEEQDHQHAMDKARDIDIKRYLMLVSGDSPQGRYQPSASRSGDFSQPARTNSMSPGTAVVSTLCPIKRQSDHWNSSVGMARESWGRLKRVQNFKNRTQTCAAAPAN